MARHAFRFLLPNGFLFPRHQLQFLHRNCLRAQVPAQQCRQVTGNAVAKPSAGPRKYEAPSHRIVSKDQLVLEMPDKYRPPSHGRRLKEQIPRNYGPELTREQRAEQRTKRYPNSFPPEGTWMFWFLTCKQLHAYIALTTLFCLAAFTTFENWRKDTTFKSQLPSPGDLWEHPIDSFWRTFYLIRLDAVQTTIKTHEMRTHEVNDVHKRNTYRKHHGIEDKQGIGPWMPAEERLKVWKEKRRAEGLLDEEEEEEKPKRAKRMWMGINWG